MGRFPISGANNTVENRNAIEIREDGWKSRLAAGWAMYLESLASVNTLMRWNRCACSTLRNIVND